MTKSACTRKEFHDLVKWKVMFRSKIIAFLSRGSSGSTCGHMLSLAFVEMLLWFVNGSSLELPGQTCRSTEVTFQFVAKVVRHCLL